MAGPHDWTTSRPLRIRGQPESRTGSPAVDSFPPSSSGTTLPTTLLGGCHVVLSRLWQTSVRRIGILPVVWSRDRHSASKSSCDGTGIRALCSRSAESHRFALPRHPSRRQEQGELRPNVGKCWQAGIPGRDGEYGKPAVSSEFVEPTRGIEPRTPSLRVMCSAS
jgi:hypothetical protein